MSRRMMVILGVIAVVGLFVGLGAMFTVDQREQVIVLQFGEPIRLEQEPGLYFKTPLIQDVIRFDKRLLDYDNPAEEIIASDQKRLVVDAFARSRVGLDQKASGITSGDLHHGAALCVGVERYGLDHAVHLQRLFAAN